MSNEIQLISSKKAVFIDSLFCIVKYTREDKNKLIYLLVLEDKTAFPISQEEIIQLEKYKLKIIDADNFKIN